MNGEIKTPLVALNEGEAYTPGPGEYVVLDDHSGGDIIRHAIAEIGIEDVRYIVEQEASDMEEDQTV